MGRQEFSQEKYFFKNYGQYFLHIVCAFLRAAKNFSLPLMYVCKKIVEQRCRP